MPTINEYTFFKKAKTTTGNINFKFLKTIRAKTKAEAIKQLKQYYNTKTGLYYCVKSFGDTNFS